MKKVLLLAFCAAAMLTVQAQPTVTNSWTKSQTDILSVANVNNSNPVAVSAQGDMYATGLFTESFTFGGKEIEAVATSSYLLNMVLMVLKMGSCSYRCCNNKDDNH